jgi:hypothetical protein
MWWSGWRDYSGGSTLKVPRPDDERGKLPPLKPQSEVVRLLPEWQTESARTGRGANQLQWSAKELELRRFPITPLQLGQE